MYPLPLSVRPSHQLMNHPSHHLLLQQLERGEEPHLIEQKMSLNRKVINKYLYTLFSDSQFSVPSVSADESVIQPIEHVPLKTEAPDFEHIELQPDDSVDNTLGDDLPGSEMDGGNNYQLTLFI